MIGCALRKIALGRADYDIEKVTFTGTGHAVCKRLGYALQRRGFGYAVLGPSLDVVPGVNALTNEWNRQCGGDSMIAVASLHASNRTGD